MILRKLGFVLCFLFVSVNLNAQTIKISSTQTRGNNGNNAELKCNPVKFTKTATIIKVEGDCQGLWIVRANKVIHTFPNNKKALGTVLEPGTYYMYPNLKTGKNTASVTVTMSYDKNELR